MVAETDELLRRAAWGKGSWDDVCTHLAGGIPGSAVAIVNHDPANEMVRSAFVHGVVDEYVDSYRDHYSALNPWMEPAKALPAGTIFVSERHMPASSFAQSEFYSDWLEPQGNMDAMTGVRLAVSPRDAVHLAWHYSSDRAPDNDRLAVELMQRLLPDIEAALRDAAALREAAEGDGRLSAFIEHVGGPALVIDGKCRILEANREAERGRALGTVMVTTGGVLGIRDGATQRWMEETVARLCDGRPVSTLSRVFEHENRVHRISVSALPPAMSLDPSPLLSWRRTVLVVIQRLVGGVIHVDNTALRVAFGLSSAEIRLCELLINGQSLAEAARALGLSDGTIRQRVKAIFQKTHTHRQGELIALLNRFSVPE